MCHPVAISQWFKKGRNGTERERPVPRALRNAEHTAFNGTERNGPGPVLAEFEFRQGHSPLFQLTHHRATRARQEPYLSRA